MAISTSFGVARGWPVITGQMLAAVVPPVPPVPDPAFALSQLPAGALRLDVDPAAIVPAGGVVPSFADATGGYAFAATGSAQPAYLATYGAAAKPALLFDGTDDIMSAAGTLPATCWIFAVVERRASNNVSTSDGRTIFEYPRAGDNLRHSFGTVRTTTDSAQTLLRRSGAGAALSSAANNNFAIDGTMHVIEVQNDALGGASLGNDGAEYGARIGTTGATTASGLNIGGSTVNGVDRQGMVLMRLIAVDHSLIPGGRRNLYVKKLIGAHLQWLYGVQVALPALSPFKDRAPLASDLKPFSLVVQTWGNSIANFTNPFVVARLGYGGSTSAAQVSFGARGVAVARSDVGGTTFTEINRRQTAGENTGTGTNDGTPLGMQNVGVVLSGELYQNGVDASVSIPADWATMATLLDNRMAFVANEQGVSIAASRHGIWAPWVSWGDASAINTGVGRPSIDAEAARVKSAYPGQVIRNPTTGMTPSEYACSLSAPGSQYADPAQFARGQPPSILNREYDAGTGVGRGVHPNDILCDLIAQNVIVPWLQSKGWVA